MVTKRFVLIAGPTASGKSALALQIARAIGGEVINADSMQVYSILRVITARPSPDEMEGIAHHLYGHVHPASAYSVAAWLEDLREVLEDLQARDRVPVLVGGTGLYFKTLLEGISPVPPIDPGIRAGLRQRAESELAAMHAELESVDPAGAQRLRDTDSQRIVRALEVFHSTGKPLGWWQAQTAGNPLLDPALGAGIVLEPERPVLHDRIAQRFSAMMENGALNEARTLLDLSLDETLPAMRAIGVRELMRHAKGELSASEAAELAVIATRQYAKRQSTWFRNQFGDFWHHQADAETAFRQLMG